MVEQIQVRIESKNHFFMRKSSVMSCDVVAGELEPELPDYASALCGRQGQKRHG
jgi:hypothetical protein